VASDAVIALVSGGAAVASGLIVAGSNYLLRRFEVHSREHDELRAALVSFLHALDLIGFEAGRQPRPGRTVRWVNRFLESRLPQVDYTTGRLHERMFTPHLTSLMDRFSHAANRLLMVAPLALLPQVEAVTAALADYQEPTPEWLERFDAARGDLIRAAREAVGGEVPESTGDAGP
jgi:hypothetical protein